MPFKVSADETEGAVEALVKKQNGDPKTIQDAIDVVLAVHHDSKKRDEQIVDYLRDSGAKMESYVERIHSLEDKQSECADRVRAIVQEMKEEMEADHLQFHNEHVAQHHEPLWPTKHEQGSLLGSFSKDTQDMTTAWRVGRWVVMILIVAGLGWGVTYWADSCASQKAESGADHYDIYVPSSPTPIPNASEVL